MERETRKDGHIITGVRMKGLAGGWSALRFVASGVREEEESESEAAERDAEALATLCRLSK